MAKPWKKGSNVAIRGVVHNRVWVARSVIVVQDLPEETVLALIPGAECACPEWYLRKIYNTPSEQTRWEAAASADLKLELTTWSTLRFLMILTPGSYYSVSLVWDQSSDEFHSYYVNFQLPYWRSHCGFDTYDLELDIVVDRDFDVRWKDKEKYQEGVCAGGIEDEWAAGIAAAKPGILEKIQNRIYPFDNRWHDWSPDSAWSPPRLPSNWQKL